MPPVGPVSSLDAVGRLVVCPEALREQLSRFPYLDTLLDAKAELLVPDGLGALRVLGIAHWHPFTLDEAFQWLPRLPALRLLSLKLCAQVGSLVR